MTKTTRLKALQNQTHRLKSRLTTLRAHSDRLAWARLLIIGLGTISSGLLGFYIARPLASLPMLITLISFGITIYYHRQVQRAIRLFQANLELKQNQIARMQLDWANIPNYSQWQADYHHPFEADLDVHGPNSLMHLIDNTIFHESTHTLRSWLAHPIPDWAEIQTRQKIVSELIPLSLFRDKLIIKASVVSGSRKTWGARAVMQWLKNENEGEAQPLWRWVVGGFMLIGLNLLLYALAVTGVIPPIWQATVLIYFALLMARARTNGAIFNEAIQLQQTLQQLTTIFEQLEQFSYRRTPHLRALCQPFLSQTHRPTAGFNHLTQLVLAVSLRNNPLLWLTLNAIFPWDLWFAYRLNRHKQQIAPHAADWLARWFKLEALNSLANLAYLNPHYSLPNLLSADEPTVFQAEQLGHPLLPDEAKVGNDFTVERVGSITLITGSNMAGKSTFLRTLGVNLILAYAGGPVNANSMQTRLFRLFSCIKVSDSVTSGVSYFYAEVKRLKWLLMELQQAHPLPLLFFIDEIFRGTNNRERFIGSTAYINALVGKNGVGFVSTHDLELAKLADKTDSITNYHFRDLIVDERMTFDYLIRLGACPTTNALKIMAIEGLPT